MRRAAANMRSRARAPRIYGGSSGDGTKHSWPWLDGRNAGLNVPARRQRASLGKKGRAARRKKKKKKNMCMRERESESVSVRGRENTSAVARACFWWTTLYICVCCAGVSVRRLYSYSAMQTTGFSFDMKVLSGRFSWSAVAVRMVNSKWVMFSVYTYVYSAVLRNLGSRFIVCFSGFIGAADVRIDHSLAV